MPAERVSMRKIRDVLRLTHALGMSRRLVGEATGIGKTAVGEYVRRAAVAGLSWPIPDEIDDAELERRLFPPPDTASSTSRTEPDWSHNHAELKRRGVTLALLWQEYRAEHAQGYAYSWFCERYSDWRKRISPTMRQTHLAGEKLFVDWAGDTMPVFDPTTGEEHCARIFVAALGASNYTYAEARWTETLPDWIGAHVNACAAIGGVSKALVPDNLKAGITKPSRYEPGINRTYQDLADHYGCVVLPARVMKPRDKAKVEVAVQIVQRFVLAKLRHRRFFSLVELNAATRKRRTARRSGTPTSVVVATTTDALDAGERTLRVRRNRKERRCLRIPHMTAWWPSGSPAWPRRWRSNASSPILPRSASRSGLRSWSTARRSNVRTRGLSAD